MTRVWKQSVSVIIHIELQSSYDQGMVEKHGWLQSHRTTIILWPRYGRKACLCISHIELQSSYDQGLVENMAVYHYIKLQSSYDQGMVEKHGCVSVT